MAVDDSYTKTLLHLNGADASTTFIDESGKTWSVNANAQIDTGQSKFGGASALFDGIDDYIYCADDPDHEPGSDNFTIDFWIRPNVSANCGLFGKHTNGAYDEYYCYINATNYIQFNATLNGSTWGVALTSSATTTAGNWYHVAIVRNGDRYDLYINGTSRDNTTVSGAIRTGTHALWVGSCDNYDCNGWIDEFRFSKGIARWTTDFTPPTSEYAPISTEVNLIPMWFM